MKKILLSIISFCTIFSSVSHIHAETESIDKGEFATKVMEADRQLYGDKIDEVIVLYDEELGIDLSKQINNPISTYAFIIDEELEEVYSKSFSRVEWIIRDGIYSLSIYPKFPLNRAKSWNAIAYKHWYTVPYDSNPWWKANRTNPTSYDSMNNQYLCHFDIASGLKIPWNIEPNTPDKGYWGFANPLKPLEMCN